MDTVSSPVGRRGRGEGASRDDAASIRHHSLGPRPPLRGTGVAEAGGVNNDFKYLPPLSKRIELNTNPTGVGAPLCINEL